MSRVVGRAGENMKEAFETIYRFYAKFLTGIAVLAAFAFFAMMWLIDANALSRKLFNFPVVGTLEGTEALMVIAILMPMAYTQMRRGHIRVTLLTKRLPQGTQRLLYALTLLIGMLFAAWATYASFEFFMRSYSINEQAWGSVRFPIYPSKGAVALGMGLLSVQFLLDFIRVAVFRMKDEEFFDHGDDESAPRSEF